MNLDELEAENRELKNEILRLSSELASMNKHFDTLNFYHDKICKQSRIKEDLLRNLLYTSSIPFYKKYFFQIKVMANKKMFITPKEIFNYFKFNQHEKNITCIINGRITYFMRHRQTRIKQHY